MMSTAPTHTAAPAPALRQPVLVVAAAIVAGAALGIVTQILQGWLPGAWGVVANSGVVWAVGAFGVGTLIATDRLAALAGAVTLVVASVSYYQAVEWFEHSSSSAKGVILWSLAGICAGPVFGIAGRWARALPDRRPVACAVVGGTLLAEGIHLIWLVGVDTLWPAGVVELVLGALVLVWSARSAIVAPKWPRAGRTTVGALTVLAAGAAALLLTLLAGHLIDGGFATL